MKISRYSKISRRRSGLTLIEMTVVIVVLLTLTAAFFVTTGPLGDWQKATDASSVLRGVETAQREFLSNNPQRDVTTLTEAEVADYIPGSATTLPTSLDLDGNVLLADPTVSPPIWLTGAGVAYDPSPTTSDSLWDVGK